MFMIGCAFGSFANVVASRLPRGEDFIVAHSCCENCHHRLGWYDLIPIISWILLKGRCRYCHLPISWRYIIVEIVTGGAFSYIFWRYQGVSLFMIGDCCLFLLGLMASLIDWQEQVVYSGMLFIAMLIPLVQLVYVHNVLLIEEKLLGVTLAGIFYGGIYLLGKIIWKGEAFGKGDIYYYMVVSFWFSYEETLAVGIMAFIVGGIYCSICYLTQDYLRERIAFIPFIFIAEIVIYLLGTAWMG